MNESNESCDMSTLTRFINVACSSIISVMCLFCMKQLIHVMIYSEMRFLRTLWINFSRDTWSITFATSKFNNVATLFLFMFQMIWICFVKNFNVVLHTFFRRSFICVLNRNLCVSIKLLIRLTMIDSSVLFNVLKRIINLYALRFV
jgi:hypothetical protein